MFKEIELSAEQSQRPNAPLKVYKNGEFLVQIFNLDGEKILEAMIEAQEKNF